MSDFSLTPGDTNIMPTCSACGYKADSWHAIADYDYDGWHLPGYSVWEGSTEPGAILCDDCAAQELYAQPDRLGLRSYRADTIAPTESAAQHAHRTCSPTTAPNFDDLLWNDSVEAELQQARARLCTATLDDGSPCAYPVTECPRPEHRIPTTLVRNLGQGWSIHRTS